MESTGGCPDWDHTLKSALFGLWSYCPPMALLAALLGEGNWGVSLLVPKSWSLAPFTPGRLRREAFGTSVGRERGVDLAGFLCLKATSGQSDQRAARGRGYRKAWSRERGELGPSANTGQGGGHGCPA